MPARRPWRQAEATRHRTLANLVRDLTIQCRTQSMRPPPAHQPPMGCNPQVARTQPSPRPRRITLTKALWFRRYQGAHLEPARSQNPKKPHPTHPSAQPTGKRCPAGTTAAKTLLMPSWSPAGVIPTRTQHRLPRMSARSHDATLQKAHPSRCHARHTSSVITAPWVKLSMLPPQMQARDRERGSRPGL